MAGQEHDDATSQGPNDTRHHEVFDPTPVTEAVEGEPITPMWLPAIGVGLVVLVPICWMAMDDSGDSTAKTDNASASPTTSAAASPPNPATAAAAARARRPKTPSTANAAAGKDKVPELSPKQLKELRDRLKERMKGGGK